MEVKNKLLALATACAVASSGWILCEEYRRKNHISELEKRIKAVEVAQKRMADLDRVSLASRGVNVSALEWVKTKIIKEAMETKPVCQSEPLGM